MPVGVQEKAEGKTVEVFVSGKLTRDDYERFVPTLEQLIRRHGKVRLLFQMHDFHGWGAAALWEDLKFGIRHFSDVERLAMVGEAKWQKGMSVFCRPFTGAEIRYFDHAKADEARDWLGQS